VCKVWRRIEAWLRRRSLDRDLEEELRFHLDMKRRETGSRAQATRALGSALLVREIAREAWGWRWLDDVLWDIRYALRRFRQNPGFTAVAITMLALGIGLNSAVFTVTNAVLFKGFRLIDRNDRILYIHNQKNGQYSGVSYPDFQDWRAQARSFDGMGAVLSSQVTLTDQRGLVESHIATQITANGFRVLGQKPILGRDFVPSDETLAAAPVAILSYAFWERRYGKDPAIIGQTMPINGVPPTTVIGVMPEGFSFPQDQALWMPLVPTRDLQRREARSMWFAFGRMAEGVTRESARAELEVIGRRLAATYAQTNQGQIPQPKNFTEFFVGPNATLIYQALWGAVGLVLMIACANLANLLLSRAIGRSREISVRMALGAGRWRIVRQLLIESLVLSIMGGACGWAIARWGIRAYALATNPPVGQYNRDLLDYTMDDRVHAYLMAISLGAGFLFGLAPALRMWTVDFNTALRDGSRGATAGARSTRVSSLLVIGEMALAIVLLAGAGVMMRSFLNLAIAPFGISVARTLTMELNLPEVEYSHPEARVAFFDRLKTHLDAIPGVESTSIGTDVPWGGAARRPYELAGAAPVDEQSRPTIPAMTIGPDYFRTLGATVLSGREFNDFDNAAGSPAVIVNERFASQHWPGQNAVGQRLRLFNGQTSDAWLTVVGVASNIATYRANVSQAVLSRPEITPLVYLPYRQGPSAAMWVFVRTPLSSVELVSAFRREISTLDPHLPIWLGPLPLAQWLARGPYGNIRNQAVLFLIFAVMALLLASVGLYAVVAHSVSQRTQEIGIRTAMGAMARDILALVFRQGMLPVGIGLTLGLAAALAVTPILKSQLVQVSPADPITIVVASATLIVAATLGCLIPARRALRVDPVVALRHE
jgi:putative ABC transport system permease protein